VWCILGKHFRREVDVISLVFDENEAHGGDPVSSAASDDDAWWSGVECRDSADVITVLSRQASHNVSYKSCIKSSCGFYQNHKSSHLAVADLVDYYL